jgi:uncharacterized protein (DUF2164 family)
MELYKLLASYLPNDAKYNVWPLDGARIGVKISARQHTVFVTFVPQHLGYIPYVQGITFEYARVFGMVGDLESMLEAIKRAKRLI